MRGKHLSAARKRRGRRIIPAHAGQTTQHGWNTSHRTDHPRACGANNVIRNHHCRTSGSSPRMRGKPQSRDIRFEVVRIIPAHAGQTARNRGGGSVPADHPRACGANAPVDDLVECLVGSSPRMRGKHAGGAGHRVRRRIIPAHAGQTSTDVARSVVVSDHPRACGANLIAAVALILAFGSSPRMRGKRGGVRRRLWFGRIIPAHAGQTSRHPRIAVPATDHPRACGANVALSIRAIIGSGSSPRMRGKLASITRKTVSSRIIPAHAGQTIPIIHAAAPLSDHPRACGANTAGLDAQIPQYGSSPRMRGKP